MSSEEAAKKQETHKTPEGEEEKEKAWPQKSVVDGAGQVVTDVVNTVSNFMIGIVKGSEAAKEDQKRTEEMAEGKKKHDNEHPETRYKGSGVERFNARKEAELQERLAKK
ncbi:hypothetical protein ACA910_007608 [Epithemia clementina (nom. ined.)]